MRRRLNTIVCFQNVSNKTFYDIIFWRLESAFIMLVGQIRRVILDGTEAK